MNISHLSWIRFPFIIQAEKEPLDNHNKAACPGQKHAAINV